eukprot:TRINITY_DN2528_c0_g1_i1.p1 TRINITY_DN2528_c0_g1~~TRINITY_DN2528_c0_g1_i1.p1  ORF type:complete len:200 (+),score=40.18 TRINITY_DN2528_c0_g1_i1:88-687(+)
MERSNTCPTCRAVIPADNDAAPPQGARVNLFRDQPAAAAPPFGAGPVRQVPVQNRFAQGPLQRQPLIGQPPINVANPPNAAQGPFEGANVVNEEGLANFLAQLEGVRPVQFEPGVFPRPGDVGANLGAPNFNAGAPEEEKTLVTDGSKAQLEYLRRQTVMIEAQMDFHRNSLAFLQQQYHQMIQLQQELISQDNQAPPN